ncbi:MAG: NAD(P)/FAD-dependent oxidoreductase [Planctomycetota bacterium]
MAARGRARADVQPLPDRAERRCDVLVVGAGAAGLLAALAARGALAPDGAERTPPPGAPDVVLLNNEARLGLKILVSGGGRCNLTNAQVDEGDYETDAPRALRGVLLGFPAAATRELFSSRGCRLYEEPLGKVFPRSDDAREVLGLLLRAVERAGISLVAPAEVTRLEPELSGVWPGRPARWRASLAGGSCWQARRVVLATGGKSLPKTGSRGFGLDELARLGHELAPPLPALTPLLLRGAGPLGGLAGLTVPAVLSLAPRGASPEQLAGARFRPLARAAGSLLVTHKGATGPAPFDVSGACGRALLARQDVVLRGDLWSLALPEGPWAAFRALDKQPGASLPPGDAPRPPTRERFEEQARPLLDQRERPLGAVLATWLPRALVSGLLRAAELDPALKVKQVDARGRARLHLALTQADLALEGTEGYGKAEVTSGGVLLGELDRRTLESRRHPGLHCCGEVVNVTGRLGGFNFQWAWASGYAAGCGAAAGL